jgi:hypothetical protein
MLEPVDPIVVNQVIHPFESTQKAIVLPFNLERNLNFEGLRLCVIPVLIEGTNGKQSFELLVDTGAETTVLSEDVAHIIGVDLQEGSVRRRGVGGKSPCQRGMVENIEIVQKMEVNGEEIEGKISLGRSKVMVGQLSGKFMEYSILGILGAETIQEICLMIDYPKKYLEFSKILLTNQIGGVNE